MLSQTIKTELFCSIIFFKCIFYFQTKNFKGFDITAMCEQWWRAFQDTSMTKLFISSRMVIKMLSTGAWKLHRCELYSCFMGSFMLFPESYSYSVHTVHAKAGWVAFKALCILGVWLNKHIATITAQFVDGLYGPSLSAAPSDFVAEDDKCTRHEKTLNTFHADTLVCIPWRTSAR